MNVLESLLNLKTEVMDRILSIQERLDLRLVRTYQYALDMMIHLLILFWVVVLFVDGFFISNAGFNRLETLYYLLLLLFLLVRTLIVSIDRSIVIYLLFIVMVVLLGILISGPGGQRLISDVRYLIRSIIIGLFVFWFYKSTPWISYRDIKYLFVVYWSMVTGFVLLHFFFGVGGVVGASGQIKPIYTSYFKEANVVAFSYLVSWFHLYAVNACIFKRIAFTVISLGIAVLMSSKALVLMIIGLIVLFFICKFAHRSYRRKLFIQLLLAFVLLSFSLFWSDIWRWLLLLFAKISPDGAVILYRLKAQDILTVLLSTRNLKIMALFDAMRNEGLTEWLFGLGTADAIEGKELVESDPFDIFKFYGIIGVLLYALLLFAAWKIISSQRMTKTIAFEFYMFFCGILLAAIIVSAVTGHIFTGPGAMVILGLVFGIAASNKIRFEMESYSFQYISS